MRWNPLSIAGAVLLALPVTLGRAIIEARALPPSQDPFYKPPSGFESAAPGDVLRSRRIVASFFGFVPDPIEAFQLLYRTTSVNGSAIATVTTVFKPLFAKGDRFVTYNTAYDSSGVDCAPSYAYQLGSTSTNFISDVEFLEMQLYLLSGYIVSAADYEGPEAAFSAGYLAGMGVLDGMRAVKNFGDQLGLSSDPMIVGMGYSGGGLATGWAAALHPTYAPDLSVSGWAAGGVPANLSAILEYIDDTVVSGFEPIAVAGLLKPTAYGAQLQPVVDKVITPAGQQAIQLGGTQCAVASLLTFPFNSILDTKFQSLGRGLLTEPTVARILANNTLGVVVAETPIAPVMLYHAESDEIVPYGPAAIVRQSWCDYGAAIKFTNYKAGGHGTTAVLAIVDAFTFTKNAFSGSIAPGCTSRTVLDDQLNPLALGVALEPFVVQLINWIVAMGQKDANWLEDIKNGKAF